MAQIYSEDAYSLGLLISYAYTHKRRLPLESLKKFHAAIEYNLKNVQVFDMYCTLHSDMPCIYYKTKDQDDVEYLCIKNNVDIYKAVEKYFHSLSKKTLNASEEENALEAIGLENHKGNIRPIADIDKLCKKSNDFIDDFINKLQSGEITVNDNSDNKEYSNERVVVELEGIQNTLNKSLSYKVNNKNIKRLSRKKDK